MDISEVTERMNRHLGVTLVAVLAGVNDRQLPRRWARGIGSAPSEESAYRLMVAHRIWQIISDAESDDIARAWFVGANACLDEQAPVTAIRSGQTRQAALAARTFVDGAWQG